jgi:hypothetical protein
MDKELAKECEKRAMEVVSILFCGNIAIYCILMIADLLR